MRRGSPRKLDLAGDAECDAILHAFDAVDIKRAGDGRDVGLVDEHKIDSERVLVADIDLDLGLVIDCLPGRAENGDALGALLDEFASDRIAPVGDRIRHPGLEFEFQHLARPENREAVGNNNTEQAGDHAEPNGKPHRCEPHERFARRGKRPGKVVLLGFGRGHF